MLFFLFLGTLNFPSFSLFPLPSCLQAMPPPPLQKQPHPSNVTSGPTHLRAPSFKFPNSQGSNPLGLRLFSLVPHPGVIFIGILPPPGLSCTLCISIQSLSASQLQGQSRAGSAGFRGFVSALTRTFTVPPAY